MYIHTKVTTYKPATNTYSVSLLLRLQINTIVFLQTGNKTKKAKKTYAIFSKQQKLQN